MLGTVRAVEDIEMPNLGNIPTSHQEHVDEVKYYGMKITTEKGRCVIDYRNNSNGYYGAMVKMFALPSSAIYQFERLKDLVIEENN